VIEFNRLDPVGTVFGLVADIRQALEEGSEARTAEAELDGTAAYMGSLAGDVFEAAMWAVFKNVLSKAWLDSIEGMNQMAAARTPDEFSDHWDRWKTSLAARGVPGSGLQRQADKWDDGVVRAARGLIDGWFKASWGGDTLPPRLDPVFGRPMEYQLGERLVGFKGGPVKRDPVNDELARLAFDITPPRFKQRGVELNQEQMNRLLAIRGHEAVYHGATLEERVSALILDPEWDAVPDPEKVQLLKESMSPYTRLAVDQLLREDDDFAYRALRHETRQAFRLQGRSMTEADQETLRFAQELGIQR
jgi:hypothetical protein